METSSLCSSQAEGLSSVPWVGVWRPEPQPVTHPCAVILPQPGPPTIIRQSDPTWSRVFEDKVFIVKLLPVDGLAPGAIVVGEITALAHELGDDAVEAAALEAKALLVGAQAAEILWGRERKRRLSQKTNQWGHFLGDPMVKIPCFQGRSTGSIPGWGTKIPHASGAWSKEPQTTRSLTRL